MIDGKNIRLLLHKECRYIHVNVFGWNHRRWDSSSVVERRYLNIYMVRLIDLFLWKSGIQSSWYESQGKVRPSDMVTGLLFYANFLLSSLLVWLWLELKDTFVSYCQFSLIVKFFEVSESMICRHYMSFCLIFGYFMVSNRVPFLLLIRLRQNHL